MKRLILIGAFLFATAFAFGQTQCKAIKKDGNQCKMMKVDDTGYCRFHSSKTVKCAAKKKDGKQCGNVPVAGEKYCHLHKPKD